jgi:hypothetical protein
MSISDQEHVSDSEPEADPEPSHPLPPTCRLRGKPKLPVPSSQLSNPPESGKTFFLPTMRKETFIDDGCTLDPQGYPLLHNGSTFFVKLPKADIKNFGQVGFPKRVGVEY